MERVWDLAGVSAPKESQDSNTERDAIWSNLKSRIEASTNAPQSGTSSDFSDQTNFIGRTASNRPALRLVKSNRRWLAMAASIALLLAAGYGFWQIPVTVTAPAGEMVVASLPDGSTVELNSGASIRYARGFTSLPIIGETERMVHLNGEAYFDIEKSDASFKIHTFNTQVAVLGTQFNVRAWQDGVANKTAVTLESGVVEVSSLSNQDAKVILDKVGERTEVNGYDSAPVEPEQVDLEATLIWRSSGLSIYSEVLQSVFEELERRFDVNINVENDVVLTTPITIMFPNPGSLESILDDICTSHELNYRKTSRGYEIY